MSGNLKKYFKKLNMTNKISHSFIVGNTTLNDIKKEIEEVLSQYFFSENVNMENDNDIIIIEPGGLFITKDQILEMQLKVQNTSYTHNKKIYIINHAEKLNLYAANSLLKLLEEPEENIYAILITNNINNVLPTIKSRCQLIFLQTEELNNIIEELDINNYILAIKFIKILEKYGKKTIAKYVEIQKLNDKTVLNEIFYILLLFYRDVINFKTNHKLSHFQNEKELIQKVEDANNLEELTKKILIINDIIVKLNYNLNINLLLDKFVIEFGGVKND